MRHELNLWVAGGDLRQAKLAELLAADGHTVHTWALEGHGPLSGVRQEEDPAGAELAHCVILPLPAEEEGGLLHAPLSHRPRPLEELLGCLRPGQLVCAGMAGPVLTALASERDLILQDYFAREELAVANAVPTALFKGPYIRPPPGIGSHRRCIHVPNSHTVPLRVAAYCRVSTDKEDQLHSLAAQRQFFLTYLAEHSSWRSAGIYADEGLSGTSASRRPQFSAMIDRAMAGEIDLILTREVSRFARNTVDTLQLTRQLKARGVGVCFLSDGIDTRENDGEFRLTIMASVAQEESRKISQRTRWGQLQAMRRGVVFGNDSIYGYHLTGGVLTVVPAQAAVVRRIFQAFLTEGKGAHTIARELTEAAVSPPLRSAGPWSAAAVLRVLHNEKYTGDLLQHKYHTTDHLSHRKIRACSQEDSFWLRDHHPAIIPRATFEAAQRELARRAGLNKAGRRHSVRRWYSGILTCGLCGRALAAKQTRRKNGSVYLRFVCRGHLDGSGCTAPSLSGSALRASVRAVLSLLGLDPAALARALGNTLVFAPRPGPPEPLALIEGEFSQGDALLEECLEHVTRLENGLLLRLRQFPLQFLVRLYSGGRNTPPQAAVIGCFPVSGAG